MRLHLKKAAVLGLVSMLVSTVFVMPVSAHGHHGRQTGAGCGYDHEHLCEVCTVEDCTRVGWHVHDGGTYCGYDHESGYCDGTCDSIAVCAVEGCVKTGRHTHDGHTYCGYAHSSGYCDNSCAQPAQAGTGRRGCRGHRGHH